MSSVNAVTEEIIFKARVASFYALNDADDEYLTKEFGKWLKEKGNEHDFIVWRVQLIKEVKKS